MRELELTGTIGIEFEASDVKLFLSEAGGDPVTLLVNSPGGDLYQAIEIHSRLKAYEGPVTARVTSLAASGASLLIMAANKIEMCPGALLMIHEASSDFLGYRGTADAHRNAADALDTCNATAARIYAARSGQTLQTVLTWMRDETWFGPDDAISAGLADSTHEMSQEIEPFPANYAAAFRHAPAALVQLCHARGWNKPTKGKKMGKNQKPATATAPAVASLQPVNAPLSATDERNRITALMDIARQDLSAEVVDQHRLDAWIKDGVTPEQARGWVLDALASAQPNISLVRSDHGNGLNRVGMSYDHGDGFVQKVADGLLSRLDKTHEPTMGREFAGATMVDIAGLALQASGRNVPRFGGNAAKVEAAMTTSDFPAITGSVLNRRMQKFYESASSPIKLLSREVEANDFRTLHSLKLSTGPELEKVNEGGEYKYGSLSEGDETFGLSSYGKILGLTRQAMVNDDLAAFDDMSRIMGQGAAQTESKLFAELLTQNAGIGPVMSDGKELFHADHNNLAAAAGAISVASLSASRTAMMRQKGLANEIIRVMPKFLLVPPEQQTLAEQMLADLAASETGAVNPFAGKLEALVDPFLEDGSAWYVIADKAHLDSLQHAYLNGQSGPQIFTQEGFETDTMKFKCRLDFGAGFVDFRGWYRNEGA